MRDTLWALQVDVWRPQADDTRRAVGDVVVAVSEDGVRWWQVAFRLDGAAAAEQLQDASHELGELLFEEFVGWPMSASRGMLTPALEGDDLWWVAAEDVRVARVGELSTAEIVLADILPPPAREQHPESPA